VIKAASSVSALESIVGSSHVSENTDGYAVDGLVPSAVAHPGDENEVAAIIRMANADRLAVIPWGGGTSMSAGNIPARYDVAIVLDRMADVTAHEPADLTATCQAGITVSGLEGVLGKAGQIAPFDSHLGSEATVGGALATDTTGASRHALGRPRDFTIGMRAVTGDGLIVKAGGKVVKNVAGYDMCKLFVGSRGTLGVIVEATFKLMPKPEHHHRVCWLPSIDDACRLASEIYRRGVSSTLVAANANAAGAIGSAEPGSAALYTGIAYPSGPALDRANAEYSSAIEDAATETPKAKHPEALCAALVAMPEQLQVAISVLPSAIPSLAARIGEIAPGARFCAQPVTGDVKIGLRHLDEGLALLPQIREIVAQIGGSSVIESCPPKRKREIDVFGEPPPSFPLMRAVKQQFDPNNVLSPGRFVGLL
jgi:glycolate oxidase FAD binding subunit